MSLERNRKTGTRKSEMVSRIQMTAAGQRIFFHQHFGVIVSNGWINAFQRTRGQPTFSKCAGRLILIRRPVFKIASLKDIREGDRLDCSFRTTGRNCVPLPLL